MSKPDAIDDLDELLAAPERPGPNECGVCWALSRLDAATADKMRQVLARGVGAVPHGKIQDALEKRTGHRLDTKVIGRHRSGSGTCRAKTTT